MEREVMEGSAVGFARWRHWPSLVVVGAMAVIGVSLEMDERKRRVHEEL